MCVLKQKKKGRLYTIFMDKSIRYLVKMSVYSIAIYKFNVMPIKNPKGNFEGSTNLS